MRLFGYYLAGLIAILLQTAVLNHVLYPVLLPDLLLLLVVFIVRNESTLPGIFIVFLLGLLADVFCSIYPGLHALSYSLIFLPLRYTVQRLNAESSVFLLMLVVAGSLMQGVLTSFWLGFFADAGSSWILILKNLIIRCSTNLLGAWILIRIALWLHNSPRFHIHIPGLQNLDDDYGG